MADTGIDLEIRAGGPYLGFEPGTSTMAVDTGIHLGYVSKGLANNRTSAITRQ